jgi:hypothetical protein
MDDGGGDQEGERNRRESRGAVWDGSWVGCGMGLESILRFIEFAAATCAHFTPPCSINRIEV